MRRLCYTFVATTAPVTTSRPALISGRYFCQHLTPAKSGRHVHGARFDTTLSERFPQPVKTKDGLNPAGPALNAVDNPCQVPSPPAAPPTVAITEGLPDDARPSLRQALKPWLQVSKPELNALVVVTSGLGYLLTGGSLFDVQTLSGLLIGTALCATGASTWNQLIEHKHDSRMVRTQNRPLVQGRISLAAAAAFGAASSAGGVSLLYATTTPTTAFLGLATIGSYALLYTPLKRVTRFNTEVGAVVGAIPPVMGWTAALGSLGLYSAEAAYLFAVLYSWQMQHFMTIAWARRRDYANGGFVMQSLGDSNGDRTLHKGVAWAVSMVLLPFCSCYAGFTSSMFLVTGTLTNAYLLRHYWAFFHERTTAQARKTMGAGFLHLFLFLGFSVFHLSSRDEITAFAELQQMRDTGTHWCVYCWHKVNEQGHWCMYILSLGGERLKETILTYRSLYGSPQESKTLAGEKGDAP